MDTMKRVIASYINGHHEEMLALWERLVSIESGSADKAGVDAVAAAVQAEMEAAGARAAVITMKQAGNMVMAVLNDQAAEAPVILLGHMDTVFPSGTLADRPFTIRGDKAYGPGVLDMKGGIVVAIFAMKALQAASYRKRPVKLILAGDEEVGHRNSRAADRIVKETRGARAAFNCETGFLDNALVVQRKGSLVFQLDVEGVAVHAGNEPEKGRSAILEIAHKVIDIQNLTDWKRGTTYNVGTICGGTVVNAVPGHASVQIDVRYLEPSDREIIRGRLQAVTAAQYVTDTKSELTELAGFLPMKRTEAAEQLFAVVKRTYTELGLAEPYVQMVGGGSDSAYTVLAGVPTVCAMGVTGGRNHSPQEYAVVDSLFERAQVLAAAILNLDA